MQVASTSTIVTGAPARALISRALSIGARAIGSSLGPGGRGLLFDGGSGGPLHSASGLDIARRVTEQSGAASVALRILRDALWQVQRDLEDGTARVACIAAATYAQATKHVASGVSPALLNKAMQQLQLELPALVDDVRADNADRYDIAMSACAQDDIARAVSDAFATLPAKGAIDVQQGDDAQLCFERYTGYCLDVSPEAVGASVQERGLRFEMDSVHVLVVNEVLGEFGPLARILEQFALHGKSLVIVARGFEGAARDTLIANRAGLRMHVLGLVPSEAGIEAMHLLDDLCAATGATVISEETGTSISLVRPSMLGFASRLVVESGRAVFSGANGNEEVVRSRRSLLTSQALAQRYLALDRERLERRAARLAGEWAILRVGGPTRWEAQHRADGARAALAALAAADASGVVAGGGQALCAVGASLEAMRGQHVSDARRAALDCIAVGCRAVALHIDRNAGATGHDRYRPVDPLSTTLAILQHAVSVAATMLTVEVLIC
ncbi:TCP-1/cpn60 chaperonin family protein [Paraburkholderia sp. ZP32-5]|uniref:TCP-1/cpn60 chaperonin family protein n=1 Tax=Paraburkholderia sp. ZP32-5 TaxID=2883245 RepID=UPI001F474F68|nr:TCP-1/cpn60 chaperonin family protein [Paraburkholderia sp. ZP32-5]